MKSLNSLRKRLGLAVLGMLLVTLAGCNKPLASFRLRGAEKRVQEAEEKQAQQHTAELLQQTRNAINTTQNQLNQGDAVAAKESSAEAARLSKELLQRTTEAHAIFLRDQANIWIDRARTNQAQQENAELFAQIQENNVEGTEAFGKQKYDKAIQIFGKVVDDVQYLLSALRKKATDGLAEAESLKEELIAEGAPEHAPEFINKIDQQITQIRDNIEREYNYRTALAIRDQARQTKQEGIQQTKKVKSDKQLTEIENLLDEATTLGAETYTYNLFSAITKEFENLVSQFYEENYDTVMTQAPKLKPQVEELILETKRVAAETKIKEVEGAINSLVAMEARGYLPGRVEQLEALLADAREQYEQEAYVESREISDRALEEEQNILQEFDDLAQQHITTASDELATAEGVYEKMEHIFLRQIPGPWEGDALALENAKQALKEELRRRVNNARVNLGMAQLQREEKDFDRAIEIARDVASEAEDVRQQTFRVVAHNAILDLSNMLSQYEGQGGRQYAASEMDKAVEMLEQSKQLLATEQYREAVRRTADTKAQIEVLVQELERVAVNRIESAQQALAQAKADRAEEYEPTAFTQALVELQAAQEALAAEGRHIAIEAAIQAENLAAEASTNALRQWVQELMAEADTLINNAREAEADRYAPEKLDRAFAIRRNLQTLYDQGQYREAVDVGAQTVQQAHEALYAKVIEAENAIAKAKRFEGWEFENARLADAMVSAKYAREMMAEGRFRLAEQHAWNALVKAEEAAVNARRDGFETRMASLAARVEDAQRKGAGYYQTQDLASLLAEMNRLRMEFDPHDYEDYAQQVDLVEAKLIALMELTPDVLKALVLDMSQRMTELEQRGAALYMPNKLAEVERKLKYAQIDYQAGKYRPSYQNAKDAWAVLDEIEQNLEEREFDAALNDLMVELSDQIRAFAPVLDMGANTLLELVIGPQGQARATSILGVRSPTDLRDSITEIGARIRRMQAPRSRETLQQEMLRMMEIAKTAASNFEKMLIMDQYTRDQAREIVQTAFLQMYQARARQQELQRMIEYPNPQFKPRGVERVVSFQDY